MNEHLDLDALADLAAGEGGDDVREHATRCDDCRARAAELSAATASVSAALAVLASEPLPPEPADLAARVDAALAGESASPGGRAAAPGDVLPLAPRRTRSRWLPALAGVAAAAALVTGAAVLTQQDDDEGPATTAAPSSLTRSSGQDYTKAGLAAAVPGLLADTSAAAADSAAPEALSATTVDPLARLRTDEGLASCLAGVLPPDGDDLPLAVDYAAFEGRPAIVVLLPTSRAGTVDAYVLGAGCSQADAQLLYFTRVKTP